MLIRWKSFVVACLWTYIAIRQRHNLWEKIHHCVKNCERSPLEHFAIYSIANVMHYYRQYSDLNV